MSGGRLPWLMGAALVVGAAAVLAVLVWLHVRAFGGAAEVEGGALALAKVVEKGERVGLRQAPTTRLVVSFVPEAGSRAGERVEAAIEVDPRVAAPLAVGGYVEVRYDPGEVGRATLAAGRGAPIDAIVVVAIDVTLVVLAIGAAWRMR